MTTVEKLYEQARENAKTNGNHIDYEISQLTRYMDYQELETIANELGNKYLIRTIERGWTPERRETVVDTINSAIRSIMINRMDNPREFVK